jgi:hypothetical protein
MKKRKFKIVHLIPLAILAIILVLQKIFGDIAFATIFLLAMISLLWISFIFYKPPKFDYKIIGHILVVFGLMTFFGGALLSFWGSILPETLEMPFGHAEGIVKTKTGLIYLGLQSYNRVQVYNSSGKFIESKYVDAGTGTFWIKLDENGLVNIYTSRKQKHYVLDNTNKIIIDEQYTRNLDDYVNKKEANYFKENDSDVYYVSWGYIYPRVIHRNVFGKEHTIISQPLYIWIFGLPLPGGLFAFLGFVLMNRWDNKKKKQNMKKPIEETDYHPQ